MKALITGGAGFIGINTADYLLREGHEVVILDNLSRHGSETNLTWLRERQGGIPFELQDIREYAGLKKAIGKHKPYDALFHFAAQVAVTTSVESPRMDFETNALGTLNVLEAVRELGLDPVVLYTSTNKVYGALSDVGVDEEESRYRYAELDLGISENTPLDLYSPYGCSKGAADQYVRDYHRMYGLRTVVFRNSCIYGPRQFGIEDQGWLAWFVIAAVLQRPITIYGDGKQVRDVLFIDDLIEAMMAAVVSPVSTQGGIYNIGGGMRFSLSVWRDFGPLLSELLGTEIEVSYGDWRPGDQKIYVSDISKAYRDFGWEPRIPPREGVGRLLRWVEANRALFQ
ncbi:MAG: CDP-paratose 2-epimerase [Anaerolineae bacterium SM23_ 63]|nr:MAG: CDP-paratose 2-epimerase [Anaerolineae bacterium SM23_ 63]HEY45233.1 NAD-dependent epimerase/dehydratase family protein [Anaerolineae bacterium]